MTALDYFFMAQVGGLLLGILALAGIAEVLIPEIPEVAKWLNHRLELRRFRREAAQRRAAADWRRVFPDWADGDSEDVR